MGKWTDAGQTAYGTGHTGVWRRCREANKRPDPRNTRQAADTTFCLQTGKTQNPSTATGMCGRADPHALRRGRGEGLAVLQYSWYNRNLSGPHDPHSLAQLLQRPSAGRHAPEHWRGSAGHDGAAGRLRLCRQRGHALRWSATQRTKSRTRAESTVLRRDGGRGVYASKSYKETEYLVGARTDDSETPGRALWASTEGKLGLRQARRKRGKGA